MFSMLEKITPCLILLDIEMPGMNGFEALEKLKTNSAQAEIPVIFLTGTVDDSITERSSKLGAVGIVTKPFSAQELLEKISANIK